jgi:hypothetical protein
VDIVRWSAVFQKLLLEDVGYSLETLARGFTQQHAKEQSFFKNPGKCIQNNAQEKTGINKNSRPPQAHICQTVTNTL